MNRNDPMQAVVVGGPWTTYDQGPEIYDDEVLITETRIYMELKTDPRILRHERGRVVGTRTRVRAGGGRRLRRVAGAELNSGTSLEKTVMIEN